jgi:Peptidase M50B-like
MIVPLSAQLPRLHSDIAVQAANDEDERRGRTAPDTMLHEAGAVQQPLSAPAAVLAGLTALVLVSVQELWRIVRHVNVIAHESAHAVVGSSFGRQVSSMKVNRDGTGATGLSPGSGPGFVIAGIVGYLGPSAFGLGAAKLISVGHSVAVLWLAMVALALVLVVLRTPFGFAAVIGTGFLIFLVARYATLGGQIFVAYVIAWLLLESGVRVVVEHGRGAEDARYLASTTRIPRLIWAGLWLTGAVFALAIGGSLLV